jgi:hypothetical protein
LKACVCAKRAACTHHHPWRRRRSSWSPPRGWRCGRPGSRPPPASRARGPGAGTAWVGGCPSAPQGPGLLPLRQPAGIASRTASLGDLRREVFHYQACHLSVHPRRPSPAHLRLVQHPARRHISDRHAVLLAHLGQRAQQRLQSGCAGKCSEGPCRPEAGTSPGAPPETRSARHAPQRWCLQRVCLFAQPHLVPIPAASLPNDRCVLGERVGVDADAVERRRHAGWEGGGRPPQPHSATPGRHAALVQGSDAALPQQSTGRRWLLLPSRCGGFWRPPPTPGRQ